MKLVLKTAATVKPVSVADILAHSRIDAREEDFYLRNLIDAAVVEAELYTWRRFCTQTWYQYFDAFADPLMLSYPPLSSITAVTYTDTDEATQTVAGTVYEAGENNEIGLVRLKYGQDWPTLVLQQPDSVRVEFVCGYGGAADVPEPIRQAIRVHVGHAFVHREGEERLPQAFYDLLTPYRCWEFA